jgi:hypothetical protein
MSGATVKAPGPGGWGTTLTNAETGDEIKGVSRIGITIVPDDIIRIDAEIFSTGIDVTGELELYIADPSTGETKQPTRIEFKDGTSWEAP